MDWQLISQDPQTTIWSKLYSVGAFVSHNVVIKHSDAFFIYGAGTDTVNSFRQQLNVPSDAAITLFFPNHWHHMGVPSWLASFPQTKRYAHPNAIARLNKQGHQEIGNAAELRLPFAEVICVPDSKVGELWLKVKAGNEQVLVVCDAFFNLKHLPEAFFLRLMMQFFKSGPGLSISNLYLWTGLKNRQEYRRWLISFLHEHQPTIMVPSHGQILRERTTAALQEIVAARIG